MLVYTGGLQLNMVENRRAVFLLLTFLLFMAPSILAPEESIPPISEITPVQPEIDYNNYYSLSGVPFDQWDLKKIDWNNPAFYNSPAFEVINFNDDKLYQMGSFSDFLFNLPETHYSKINAVKAIDNGHGGELNVKMIEANDNERLLVQKLNPKELNSYSKKKYGIDKIDVSNCWPERCTMEKGVLKNYWDEWKKDDSGNDIKEERGEQVTLSTIQNTQAKISMDSNAHILVIINEVGTESLEGIFSGAKKTVDAPIEISSQDRFFLRVEGMDLSKEEGVWVDTGTQHRLEKGTFYFEDGELFILPVIIRPLDTEEIKLEKENAKLEGRSPKLRDKIEGDVLIDGVHVFVQENVPLKITSTKPTKYLSKELYLGPEEMIAVGEGYYVVFEKNNPYLEIENGPLKKNFFSIKPEGSWSAGIPSKIVVKKNTDETGFRIAPTVSIVGRAKIGNGETIIDTDGSHFISYPHTIKSELSEPLGGYELVDAEINFEKNPPNSLSIRDNHINIDGKKTVYFSAEYDEQGRVDISAQLGELEKGKVKKPVLMIYTPTANLYGAEGENVEAPVWSAAMDLIQVNKEEEIVPITIYLGSEFSPKTEKYNKNEKYVLDFLTAANDKNIPVIFLGHSAIDYDTQTAYISVNEDPPPYDLTKEQLKDEGFMRSYLQEAPNGARIPLELLGGIYEDNPVICGCAVGALLHEKGELKGISGIPELSPDPEHPTRFLEGRESLVVATYSTMRLNEGEDYTWWKFNEDWNTGNVQVPNCVVFKEMMGGLKTLKVGPTSWDRHPLSNSCN